MPSDVLLLCGALKSWHAADHINEDLQLERSGRVGACGSQEADSFILSSKWLASLGLAGPCVEIAHNPCSK